MWLLFYFIVYSEGDSDFAYQSSTSDHENFVRLFEKKSKKINKGRWTKEEVGFKFNFMFKFLLVL